MRLLRTMLQIRQHEYRLIFSLRQSAPRRSLPQYSMYMNANAKAQRMELLRGLALNIKPLYLTRDAAAARQLDHKGETVARLRRSKKGICLRTP